jgi:hypothetical protein
MIMVHIETAQRRWFPRLLQLPSCIPVFAAAPRPQAQPAVVPQLALRTETMRCLNQSDQKGDPDRAQPGNLFEKLSSRCFRLSANNSFRVAFRIPIKKSSC